MAQVRHKWFVLAGIMLGLFLSALEATAIATAMPTVVSSLGGLAIYSWVFSGYLLSSTVTMPLWGRLSDLHGRRPLFFAGVLTFIAGSALCGLSRNMGQLVLFRLIQGIGAGAVMPLTFTIIGDIYSLEQRTKMQGVFSGVWGFASLVGPMVGGYLADHASWRWVFYVNIPFGLLSILLIAIGLKKEEPREAGRASLDVVGTALFTISAASLLLGLSIVQHNLFAGSFLFLTFLLLIFLYVRMEEKAEHPLVPLKLFAIRMFRAAQGSGLFSGMAMFGVISFVPLYMQSVLGSSATEAGRVLIPFMLTWVVFSIAGARILMKAGYRSVILAGGVILVSGFVLMSGLDAASSPRTVMLCVSIQGAGMGFSMAPFLIAVQSAVPKDLMGAATSSTQFVRTIGGAIGVALLGATLSLHLQASADALSGGAHAPRSALEEALRHPDNVITPAGRRELAPEVLAAVTLEMANGLRKVFRVSLAFALLSFLAAFAVPDGSVHSHAWKPPEGGVQ